MMIDKQELLTLLNKLETKNDADLRSYRQRYGGGDYNDGYLQGFDALIKFLIDRVGKMGEEE